MVKKIATTILILTLFQVKAQTEMEIQPAINNLQNFNKIRDFAMDQAGTEAYFTIQSPNEQVSVIAKTIKQNNTWSDPEITSFSGEFKDLEPFLSPDGLRLYFVSNRPLDASSDGPKDFDIWYVQRESPKTDWSQPINMGAPINSEHNEFYPAVAKNGNVYFTCECPGAMGRDDIFLSQFKNGSYTAPVALSDSINSEGFEYNAFIDPEDSYLIFGGYNREDGQGSGDLYISFKDASGNWSKAKPLPAPINSAYMDYCPFVDEKNKVLYFTSRRSANPCSTFDSMDSLSDYLNSYENGSSRLYKVDFDVKSLK